MTITGLDVYMLRYPIFPTVVPPKGVIYLWFFSTTNKQTKQIAKTNNCGTWLPGSTFPHWLLLMSLVLCLGLQFQHDRSQYRFNYVTWYVMYFF